VLRSIIFTKPPFQDLLVRSSPPKPKIDLWSKFIQLQPRSAWLHPRLWWDTMVVVSKYTVGWEGRVNIELWLNLTKHTNTHSLARSPWTSDSDLLNVVNLVSLLMGPWELVWFLPFASYLNGFFAGYSARECSSALIFSTSFRFAFQFTAAFFLLHSGWHSTSLWLHLDFNLEIYATVRSGVLTPG